MNAKADAIVVNVDPAQVNAGLQTAKDANIPVFGMDAGADPLLVTNVTSNGYAMAAQTSVYVADRIGGAGDVVMFVFDALVNRHAHDLRDLIVQMVVDIRERRRRLAGRGRAKMQGNAALGWALLLIAPVGGKRGFAEASGRGDDE